MKITQRQASILALRIYEGIKPLTEKFKKCNFKKAESIAKEELNYSEAIKLAKDLENIYSRITALEKMQREKRIALKELISYGYGSFSGGKETQDVDKVIKNKIDSLLNQSCPYPSLNKIEEDVTIEALSGSKDIITSLINKYKALK